MLHRLLTSTADTKGQSMYDDKREEFPFKFVFILSALITVYVIIENSKTEEYHRRQSWELPYLL